MAALALPACGDKAGGAGATPGGSAAGVVISEIMYNPVLEDTYDEDHEFVEIANRGAGAVSLDGWKLSGDITFDFPKGVTLAPGEHKAIARKRDKLAAVAKYKLSAAAVLGDYKGELENDSGKVVLSDGAGKLIDQVKYKDEFPWPAAADGLGADEEWLPQNLRPLKDHKYMGRSLERISLLGASDNPANWEASTVDGATPGKPNSVAGAVRPIVSTLEITNGQGEKGLLGPKDEIVVNVGFSDPAAIKGAELEMFIDDVSKADEPKMKLPLRSGADKRFSARIPAQRANSVVRYRVWADRGGGPEVISPRATDPFPYHATFVAPPPEGKSKTYHLFIAPPEWTRLWDNVVDGYNMGCKLNPKWNDVAPAVFVSDGKVYDVFVRYQGSRSNRRNGQRMMMDWPFPGPERPMPLAPLSFKVKFPRYSRFEGQSNINLNKLNQACPGVNSSVLIKLMESLGLPAYHNRFRRLNVNGGYYNYVMELEDMNERLLRRYLKTGEEMGELYKSDGYQADEGDQSLGNGGLIKEHCGFSALDRYKATYRRVTHEWKDHSDLIALIEAHVAARAAGPAALKAFLEKNFDVNQALDAYAIRIWGGSWDDAVHNYYLYWRPGPRKWMIIHNDFDLDLGIYPSRAPSVSLYLGEDPNPDNVLPANLWKDSFLKVYRKEFEQRLLELSKTVLHPDNIAKMVDEGAAEFSLDDWNQAPAVKRCEAGPTIASLKTWTRSRKTVIDLRLGPQPEPPKTTYRTCAEILKAMPGAASGMFAVQPQPSEPAFRVQCDMTTDGGGWTLVGRERAGYGGAFRFLDQNSHPEELLTESLNGLIGPRFNGLYGEARIQWKQDQIRFRVSEPIFVKPANSTIAISDLSSTVTTMTDWVKSAGGAVFCRASSFPSARPGDTSWAIKPKDDGQNECGCSGANAAGRGAYYGGARPGTVVPPCLNAAGGFTGVVEDKGKKSDVTPTYETTIWVR